MTEEEAIAWVGNRFGTPAIPKLRAFGELVVEENRRQNLIAPSTIETIWSRHLTDSAQLLPLAPPGWKSWLDIGTGGGFPGMVVAILAPDRDVVMVEPRGRRVEFLRSCVAALELSRATIVLGKVETIAETFDVISARAVASLAALAKSSTRCAHRGTTWLLPRGRSGATEASECKAGLFHVEHSLTSADSVILTARGTLS